MGMGVLDARGIAYPGLDMWFSDGVWAAEGPGRDGGIAAAWRRIPWYKHVSGECRVKNNTYHKAKKKSKAKQGHARPRCFGFHLPSLSLPSSLVYARAESPPHPQRPTR